MRRDTEEKRRDTEEEEKRRRQREREEKRRRKLHALDFFYEISMLLDIFRSKTKKCQLTRVFLIADRNQTNKESDSDGEGEGEESVRNVE